LIGRGLDFPPIKTSSFFKLKQEKLLNPEFQQRIATSHHHSLYFLPTTISTRTRTGERTLLEDLGVVCTEDRK